MTGTRAKRLLASLVSGRALIAVLLAAVILIPVLRAVQLSAGGTEGRQQVGLIYDPEALDDLRYIRNAYESVLQEEGIPHAWLSITDFLLVDGEELARRYPAILFPDGLNQRMPTPAADRVEEYLGAGGNIGVIYDAGVKDTSGIYREGGLFAPALGVEYLRYDERPDDAYLEGNVRFEDPKDALAWSLPPGKLFKGQIVGGYAYGSLTYPLAAARPIADDLEIHASFKEIPVLSTRDAGTGTALWVDLPLGYLKAYSDDLPMRSILRTFLLDLIELPHLVPSPGGVGGLVLDWHIDSAVEWEGIPSMIRNGLVRRDLVQQFDITAGPDRDELGDGLGFHACGKGTRFLRRLLPYGVVGSHGGWAHNYFSLGLRGDLTPAEVEGLVARNNKCLERVTGEPVRAYSAPNGVHPQPELTRIIARQGIRGYYYTGDTGAPPNRTFFNGSMIAADVWAFPVMPNGRQASIGEMKRAGVSPEGMLDWLRETLGYVVDERTIRLVYSHPYDLLRPSYRRAYAEFLDDVEKLQAGGELTVHAMPEFAEFMSRFVRTDASFRIEGEELVVELANAAGLRDVAFALPGDLVDPASALPDSLGEVPADGERVFSVEADVTELEVRFALRP